jgi:addiction module HigA family antidote
MNLARGTGEMLLEYLKPRGLTQAEAAERMGIPLNRLNEVVRGKRGITADTALPLARQLKTDALSWMNLQNAWDLWHAQRAMKRSA